MDAPQEVRFAFVTRLAHLPLRVVPDVPLDDDALFELCALNEDLRIERTAAGELIVMAPTGGETGRLNLVLAARLFNWAERDGTGVAFDSSTGFLLPNGAERAPDAAWVLRERWDALPAEARRKFPPLCPDFVLELNPVVPGSQPGNAPSDALPDLHAKLREYMDNGARLGWLVDPDGKTVWIYRPGGAADRLEAPEAIPGDPVLPGLALPTDGLW